jgi:phospholipid/cholesterol/gamma-HCH transport system substrate-binding protein
MPRARAIAVGAFVIGGLFLFSVGLFMIGNRRMLFSDHFEAHASFAHIAGLQAGAKVRVAGMDAGEVKAIHVPAGPSARFLVVMQIRSDLHPLVRTDSVASIQNDGLVGNKFVQVETGTDAAPPVVDKGMIQSVEPFDLTDLMQKMSDAIDTIDATVADVQGELQETLSSISDTAQSAQDLVNDVGKDVRAIAESGNKISSDLRTVVADVKAGHGTVGKLITDDALYEQAKQISDQARATVENLKDATDQAKEAIADFRGEGGPMKGLTGNLTQTLAYAREAMADLADSAEALKHNFLFRGFFNRRGYFDLGDISVQQYRAGALESSGRVPLRIWLDASVLFTSDADGRESLTNDGRQRLDSAMSQFVRYPKNSPLVIEGYGQEATGDQRYLLSRARATLVRDYLVSRFSLNPRTVAIMPMGSAAPDSPTPGTWAGVAVTLFVPRAAFRGAKPVAQGLIDGR